MAITLFIVLKYIVTSFLIVAISEVAKKYDRIGGLIAALPLVTLLAMIWLYVEGNRAISAQLKINNNNNNNNNNQQEEEDALRNALYSRVNNHALYTFFYVLPTLPMFLLFPVLFQRKNIAATSTVTNNNHPLYGFYINFWLALFLCAVFTLAVFYIYAIILKHYTSIALI